MGLCIYANEKYFNKKEEAVVSVYDHGFLYGDGVFEGIRSYNRRIFRLKQHIDRLYESARSIKLEIPMSQAEMMATHIETVRRTGLADCYIRTVVSRGVGDLGLNPKKCPKPSIFIIADAISLYPEEKYKIGLKLVTVSTRRNRPDTLNARIKSLNYLNNILARIEADLSNADEGLMLNDEGYVSEATADNIFMIKGDELATPPPYMGILEGITRAAIMEIAPQVGLKSVEKSNAQS